MEKSLHNIGFLNTIFKDRQMAQSTLKEIQLQLKTNQKLTQPFLSWRFRSIGLR
jgi:hypothetical protein